MGRIFTVSFADVAVTAIQDLFQIEAQGVTAKLHALFLSQSTDAGDANSEQLSLVLRRVTDAVVDGAAEVPAKPTDVAGANLAVNQLVPLATGVAIYHAEAWNTLTPFVWLPTPEMRPSIQPTDAMTVHLAEAPAQSIDISGTLYFEELD